MRLVQIRKHSSIIFYGYIFETPVIYWSMKFYEESYQDKVGLDQVLHKNRYDNSNFRITL